MPEVEGCDVGVVGVVGGVGVVGDVGDVGDGGCWATGQLGLAGPF